MHWATIYCCVVAIVGVLALAQPTFAVVGPTQPAAFTRLRGGDAQYKFGAAQPKGNRKNAFQIARSSSVQGFEELGAKKDEEESHHAKERNKKMNKIGYKGEQAIEAAEDPLLMAYVNLKLTACGASPVEASEKEAHFMRLVEPILKEYQEQQHLLIDRGMSLCPADHRIQNWLEDYLHDVDVAVPQLPVRQLKLDRHGLSRVLSLPKGKDVHETAICKSYRVAQGVVHNPKNDKRTTQGVFHVVEGGLPISGDKKVVPKITFAKMLDLALHPPDDSMVLPYTANQEDPTKIFTSLLLRPLACPEVQGFIEEKTSEVRFIVPGSMVCNLDFVESIFGNGDNPDLAENDAALDPQHWSGCTGLVVLAPHLVRVKGKDVGLPHKSQASERQLSDGLYYDKDDDLYNGGSAFKITARDARGVVVTIIADNYFGYCKKEVKTQLAYATNVYGQAEEEHAGGCIAYPCFDLGEEVDAGNLGKVAASGNAAYLGSTHAHLSASLAPRTFDDTLAILGDSVVVQEEGHAVDREFSDIHYVPEDAKFSMLTQSVRWTIKGKESTVNLKPRVTYVIPSGYKIEMVKKGSTALNKGAGTKASKSGVYETWHLKGTLAEGANLHKPATVSGGGKSEISKRLEDMIKYGPVYVNDVIEDFDAIQVMLSKDYSNIMLPTAETQHPLGTTPIASLLDARVSMGAIVNLFTPNPDFTTEHLAFIDSVPTYQRELLSVIKQYYKAEWKEEWRQHFFTDAVNGALGHELKYRDSPVLSSVIRVGFRSRNDARVPLQSAETESLHAAWKTYTLRQDFFPCSKLQTEDDITASVVVPAQALKGVNFRETRASLKFSQNCEFRLFQRPDDAIHRGYDKMTEWDMAKPGNFISNFEPLDRKAVEDIVEEVIGFEKFTEPMQERLSSFLEAGFPQHVVSSAHPRIVNGKPTANPRYLQDSMEITDPRAFHLGAVATRLARHVPLGEAVHTPITGVLCGRRNNQAEGKIPALACHNPVHYYELPELFMEITSSMTGKSPSTTGAGSEGALTKGPFNMLNQVHDLNAAVVSYAMMETSVFISSAGVIGPKKQVDHDISLLVPEVWSRMREEERSADWLISNGFLDKIPDIVVNGEKIAASVLGYRINSKFVAAFFGRVFQNPHLVFDPDMLQPELQDETSYAESVKTIIATNKRVAEMYLKDGGADMAVPPLKALLHIMATGEYKGMTLESPDFRAMWTRDNIIKSEWYMDRLKMMQSKEVERLKRGLEYTQNFVKGPDSCAGDWKGQQIVQDLQLHARISSIKAQLQKVQHADYLEFLRGSLGVDPAIYTAPNNNYERVLPSVLN
mmetsp:Transcript_70258/g.114113  ORF Transcript_70258/g.114113 Transcript_70258/m.114113 type:complete len:1322 (+) Transcript_70258:48-4013(+)